MGDAESIFNDIYRGNIFWNSPESFSGPGSDLRNTRHLRRELPYLLHDLGVSVLLDVPCGDFNWMRYVNLGDVEYIGGDIVRDLVERNNDHFGASGRKFVWLDISTSPLPLVDAVFCRDCLVHFPLESIFAALRNICCSGVRYLLTTSYSFRHVDANFDISLGEWRRLNLELEPFNFPPPTMWIVEGCEEANGRLSDKTIGVWAVDEIKKIIDLGDR